MTLHSTLDSLVSSLPKRQRDIIVRRFGLLGKEPQTLASLGEEYGITRERVRQIENAALKSIRGEAQDNADAVSFLEKAIEHIESLGGLRRADLLVDDLKFVFKDHDVSEPYVSLLFAIFKKPQIFGENSEFYPFWYIGEDHVKELKSFVKKVRTLLKSKKEMLVERKEFDQLFAQATKQHKIKEFIALNYLLNSKKFSVNPFGDFGLVEWPEITPKTVRDKSYLILKKRKEPMHFRDIAQHINEIEFDTKKAHPQTVHNELIKDKRFVLVGRGLYSLREFGVEPGTTREVLQRILKKNGALPLEDIVSLVSQERVLKYNTIFLNLQNKKYFKKNDKGHYHLA